MSTPNPASVATPVVERKVCDDCGHLHRASLRYRCRCCGSDVKKVLG